MKKEKIGEIKYKGFITEFFITPKIKEHFKKNNIPISKLIPNDNLWYEVILFESLDENEDGMPDKHFGNSFETIYYKIVTKRTLDSEIKIEDEINDYLKNALLLSATKVFNIEVDYVVVKGVKKK
jgi:hypothetical protein